MLLLLSAGIQFISKIYLKFVIWVYLDIHINNDVSTHNTIKRMNYNKIQFELHITIE